ncbi:hypothetical protein QL285_094070 [Trifolium repens]|nr:hypothetical protein QL285_094070 [Trifolium repens]
MQTGTQELRITKAGISKNQRQCSHRKNSQSDERWSKLKKRSCNQKVNGQEDHLTKASTGSKRKRVVYRKGSETHEPLAKMTKKGEKGYQERNNSIRKIKL